MNDFDRKKHWENIYQTKEPNEVSWFQPTPATSLHFIESFNIPVTDKIMDIGGGDGFLVDHLLDRNYQDITVVDISEAALDKAKTRLGDSSSKVKWITADAASLKLTEKYDFWHDRAAFHFLTSEEEIENYIDTAQQSIKPDGIMVIGTFSENGPEKCSGLKIKQYSEATMSARLEKYFDKIECIHIDHQTPFGTIQNFIFCSFRRIKHVAD